jgi:uncharacterized protein (TIGR00251 family)
VSASNIRIAVRLQPNASRDELVGTRDGVLIARVTAPALEGRANRALCKLLAKRLDVPPSWVTIVRGERGRDKLVQIEGIDRATVQCACNSDAVSRE